MGNLQDERAAIEAFLNTNYSSTAIHWDNVDFDQSSVSEYIAPFIRNGKTFPTSLGGNQISYESTNSLVISIFTKKGIGSDKNREIADTLISLFLKQQIGYATFYDFHYVNVGDVEEWYRGNLILFYRWKKCI